MTCLSASTQGRKLSGIAFEVRGTVNSALCPIGTYAVGLREVTKQLGHWRAEPSSQPSYTFVRRGVSQPHWA
jgi:hypothetical protein